MSLCINSVKTLGIFNARKKKKRGDKCGPLRESVVDVG